MGINKYSVQLESYFSGKMSETDRILFEGKVEANPMLKAEFEKQSDIVESLKAHRKAELKTRLNNISVQPTLIGALLQSSVIKPVAYGVITLILGTGGYLFYNKEASVQYHIEALRAKHEYHIDSHMGLNPYRQLDYRFEGNLQILDYVEAAPVLKKRDLLDKPSGKFVQDVAFEVPEVITSHEDSFSKMEIDLNAVDKINQVAGISEVDKVNIQTINSRKYNFHYRLEDNRLFLYGKFSESPYEIIEISTPKHKKLFFYYHGDFYHLKKNATSVTPLSKIENKNLILELDALKGRG